MREEEIAEYTAAVRMALADAVERDELLEDLEDHLREVATESGQPLTDRLGPPEAYAAELRAAYGAETRKRPGPAGLWHAARENAVALHRRLACCRPYRALVGFLPELRPGWWVVRGIAAVIVWGFVLPHGYLPVDLSLVIAAAASVWLSVWLGVRTRTRRPGTPGRRLIVLGNALIAVALLGAFTQAGWWHGGSDVEPEPYANASVGEGTGPLSNIYPYSKDGKPLTGVRLYDQNGKPLEVRYEEDGMQLDQPCGGPPPIANAYPLPLRPMNNDPYEPEPSCSPGTPTPAPGSGDSATPTPDPSAPHPPAG